MHSANNTKSAILIWLDEHKLTDALVYVFRARRIIYYDIPPASEWVELHINMALY